MGAERFSKWGAQMEIKKINMEKNMENLCGLNW